MSRERNVLIGLLTVVCLLQFNVIADVVVHPCPTKCTCFKWLNIGLTIDCGNRPRIDPQELCEQIDSLLISYVNDSLNVLIIRNTSLSHVPRSLCRLTTLAVLQLLWNRLVELPNNCFMDFHRLWLFYANGNDITELSKFNGIGLGQLVHLSVTGNKIAYLGNGDFDGIGQLTSLDLSDNKIAYIENGVFDGIGQLTTLVLSGNKIGYIENGVFDGIGNLTDLNLGGNKIGYIENGVFDGIGKLTNLDLSGNKIADLPSGVFNGMGQITQLGLGFNQIAEQ